MAMLGDDVLWLTHPQSIVLHIAIRSLRGNVANANVDYVKTVLLQIGSASSKWLAVRIVGR